MAARKPLPAAVDRLPGQRLGEALPVRACVRQERRVRQELALRPRLSEQLPRRHALGLPGDVPERHVDRTEGVDERTASPGHGRADVQLVPAGLRVGRIHPDHELTEASIHRVGPGRLDARPGDPGVQVGLADAGETLVRLELDDDRVLVRARRLGVVARVEQDVAGDARDLHAAPALGSVSTM